MDKTTIKDVSRAAHVSVSTVSRAFSHPELVSASTLRKVMQVADELNFAISKSVSSIQTGKTYKITLLIGSAHLEWFTDQIFSGLYDVLHPAGYEVGLYIASSKEERKKFFDTLPVRRNTDALVVSSFAMSREELSRLESLGVPIVGINVDSPSGFSASVSIDDTHAAQAATQYLLSLGHTSLAYVYQPFNSSLHYSSLNRIRGFLQACGYNTQDCHDENDFLHLLKETGASNPHICAQLFPLSLGADFYSSFITQYMSSPQKPTALFCHQDSIAIPILLGLQRDGIRVPEDLSLLGFDDSDMSGDARLTTVHQDAYGNAQQAGKKLLSLLNGQPTHQLHTLAPTQLLVRNTTARVPRSSSSTQV